MLKQIIILTLGVFSLLQASAKDLGVQGQTWPVLEIDFRQTVLESAAKADWGKARDELKASAESFFDSFPQRRIGSVVHTETRYLDPSITVESDIKIPTPDREGNISWRVLHPKGTKVNPLDSFRPLTALLFFDGNSESQVKFVQEALEKNPMKIVPLETGGSNVKALSELLKRPVFYANDSMLARFNIANLPALLYAASGKFSKYMGLTSFSEPYKYSEVEDVWPLNVDYASTTNVAQPPSDEEKRVIADLLNLNSK
jgi:conjugal transfer pilus assembly protein TraW